MVQKLTIYQYQYSPEHLSAYQCSTIFEQCSTLYQSNLRTVIFFTVCRNGSMLIVSITLYSEKLKPVITAGWKIISFLSHCSFVRCRNPKPFFLLKWGRILREIVLNTTEIVWIISQLPDWTVAAFKFLFNTRIMRKLFCVHYLYRKF